MSDKTICRITKYLTDDSFSRLVRFDELHPKLQDEIIDAINEYHAQEI